MSVCKNESKYECWPIIRKQFFLKFEFISYAQTWQEKEIFEFGSFLIEY